MSVVVLPLCLPAPLSHRAVRRAMLERHRFHGALEGGGVPEARPVGHSQSASPAKQADRRCAARRGVVITSHSPPQRTSRTL
eukprot:COSAG01_NODE_47717_length_387_cov_2.694444_1_plen_81_part_10